MTTDPGAIRKFLRTYAAAPAGASAEQPNVTDTGGVGQSDAVDRTDRTAQPVRLRGDADPGPRTGATGDDQPGAADPGDGSQHADARGRPPRQGGRHG